MVWNYYFISAQWLPPLRINKVKVKSKRWRLCHSLVLEVVKGGSGAPWTARNNEKLGPCRVKSLQRSNENQCAILAPAEKHL